ncbi:MAG: DUF547 domain-containing protein [Bacteroidota bacterium]|nr:DUF547 domain-containing protein [Bacteroidota bacterium]MDP4232897.1 DUF547 domain-containing protein [Bacteroidota bacterium]MDP4241941.1 DUF547 domain-containing protein [Bacteroidota bacterium]MDP4286844.1 DUF547 domain-containing protein [Bacteroidota bacterium]
MHPTHLRILLLFAMGYLMACGTVPNTSVTAVSSGEQLARVDDSLYANVLARAVNASGAISLAELRGDSNLTEYLDEISRMRTDVFVSRQAALAFWINAHNAWVLDLLRSNPGAKSTDDISGFRYARVFYSGNQRYSLDDIEHSVLVKQFAEPRGFFALCDGTRSSPTLRTEPYSEQHLSEQLDDQLKHFLADSTRNVLDRHTNTLYLSEIFRTYLDDFERISGSVTAFVRAFAPPAMASWIDGHPAVRISYLTYDHTINSSDIEYSRPVERPKRPAHRPTGGIQ